jgi:ketosteroid isomerase-like protein
MSAQQNLNVVRQGYDAFSRGDIDALLALLDEQVDWRTPGPPELSTAGARHGRAQVAQFFMAINELLEVQQFEPRTFVAEGDRVVVLGVDTSKVRASGRVLSTSWAHAFTVRDGRIVAFEEYMDTSALVAELRSARAAT